MTAKGFKVDFLHILTGYAGKMESSTSTDRDFVHLHLHSDYSLLQSTIQLKPLAKSLNKFGMKTCAVTDYGNMYGAISFYKTMKSNGIKPIIGYEAFVASGNRFERTSSLAAGEKPYYSLVLLAKNFKGYQNLVLLASKAFTEGFYQNKPRIDIELLSEHSDGLIGLSAGFRGSIAHYLKTGAPDRARSAASTFGTIFGVEGFYIEITRHGTQGEQELNTASVELARELGLPIVATNDVHYLDQDDSRAHDVLLCIGDGRTLTDPGRPMLPTNDYYLRSAEEMWSLFGDQYPDALQNTIRIADLCDVELPIGEGNLILPGFPIPSDSIAKDLDEYFEMVVFEGFEDRRKTVLDPMSVHGTLKYPIDDYQKRLEIEISVIKRMGYSGYFLIVWDFIKYAVERGIPVGPGRGSAAGSLVAYSLGITGIDPLQYDLFFERFLNPERISMPDIDIDFCIRGRGDVINHVSELYGRESVCQIITFGTMASKAAIKDVGRAMNIPLGDVEKIAKLIPPPFRGRITSISDAIEKVPELKAAMANDMRVQELIDLALRVEGCSRHTSVHAAGVVISPKPLHEIVPVAVSHRNEFTSQYPMGDLELVGMLKMDFLGLTTLTIINDCLRTLSEKLGVRINWAEVSLNDEKTMQLFGEGKTDAVFQFESSGMQEICRRLKPKELEDLSALNALYRPGPIDGGMIEEFILRHRGEKKVEYLLPEMEAILSNTYGVLVYQEQIMQLAQTLAGYSLGEADMMRRAMGKKKKEEMAVHEKKFVDGAIERGVEKRQAKEIFELMAKFADYGFNRSHSIAYAYLAFQTGYLKAHFPAHFYAAVLSHEADDSAKVYKYSNELRSMGLSLLPPDVNESDEGFTPSDGAVRFGLSAIKGMGAAAARAIIEGRRTGQFRSLFDFVSRIEPNAINRRTLECLVAAGAFDSLMPVGETTNFWRAKNFKAIESALNFGQNAWNDKLRGQNGLFSVNDVDLGSQGELPNVDPWTQDQLSSQEKSAIGFYLSVHPLDNFKELLANLRIRNIADFEEIRPGSQIVVAGTISALQVRWSKKGNRFATFRLEDASSGIKCLMWADAYGKYAELLSDDALIIAEGKVESAEGQEITLIVNEVRSLPEAESRNARSMLLTLPKERIDEDYLQEIYSTLNEKPGRCDVEISIPYSRYFVRVHSKLIRIQGSQRLANELRSKGCEVEWKL